MWTLLIVKPIYSAVLVMTHYYRIVVALRKKDEDCIGIFVFVKFDAQVGMNALRPPIYATVEMYLSLHFGPNSARQQIRCCRGMSVGKLMIDHVLSRATLTQA